MTVYTFNQYLKLAVFDFVILQVNLKGQQEREDKLVVFIKASDCVFEHLKSQIFNDVCNSSLGFGGLFRPAKAQ